MQPDHTAAEFAQPHAVAGAPSDDADDAACRPAVRARARATFCFAWLFGLEPFLSAPPDDATRLDRHRPIGR
ncbi:hypothetical protein [Paraburkholderia sp.]|uniref:hypothetical protein n=1 Tax=Paraburkholderia sp. TaxID=1926495 RepID=UPI002F3FFFA2